MPQGDGTGPFGKGPRTGKGKGQPVGGGKFTSSQKILVDLEKCTGCGVCLNYCPPNALSLVNKKIVVSDDCTLCRRCISSCPKGALHI